MAITISELDYGTIGGAASSIPRAVTIGSGTKRRIVAFFFKNTAITVTGVTFDGNAMNAGLSFTTDITLSQWYYDVPDAVPAGTYNVVATLSGSSSQYCWDIFEVAGAVAGAPESAPAVVSSNTASPTAVNVTSTAGAARFSALVCSSGSTVGFTNATLRRTLSPGFLSAGIAWDVVVSPGAVTITADESPDTYAKRLGALSIAAASDPSGPSPAAVDYYRRLCGLT